MSRNNRRPLGERVIEAGEAALKAQKYACPLDVFLRIGWVDGGTADRWRRGQIEHLEATLQTNPARISEALNLFREWAAAKGLLPSETDYVARAPQRQALRFSAGHDPAVEQFYRTHWLSAELPQRKRKQLTEKASRPPELVVVQPLKDKWTCHRCGGTGDLLIMENPGPACLRCAGLDDLEFVPSGDALLTRRARAKSARHAVVVRFSRTRRRYERQGLLVEPQALAEAEREVAERER